MSDEVPGANLITFRNKVNGNIKKTIANIKKNNKKKKTVEYIDNV